MCDRYRLFYGVHYSTYARRLFLFLVAAGGPRYVVIKQFNKLKKRLLLYSNYDTIDKKNHFRSYNMGNLYKIIVAPNYGRRNYMKGFFKRVFAVILSAGVLTVNAGITARSDAGEITTYEIRNVNVPSDYTAVYDIHDLKDINDGGLSNKFILMKDIDLAGEEWVPIGGTSRSFSGVFDGNGHVIKNMSIRGNSEYAGLFSKVYGGEIKNLGLENVNIKLTKGSGVKWCGGLAGYAGAFSERSTFTNCYVTGKIDAGNVAYEAGGLVGCAYDNIDFKNQKTLCAKKKEQ